MQSVPPKKYIRHIGTLHVVPEWLKSVKINLPMVLQYLCNRVNISHLSMHSHTIGGEVGDLAQSSGCAVYMPAAVAD